MVHTCCAADNAKRSAWARYRDREAFTRLATPRGMWVISRTCSWGSSAATYTSSEAHMRPGSPIVAHAAWRLAPGVHVAPEGSVAASAARLQEDGARREVIKCARDTAPALQVSKGNFRSPNR